MTLLGFALGPISVSAPSAAAQPAPTQPASAENGAAPSRSASLKFDPGRSRLFLEAKINGAGPFQFLVDSGYDLTMVHPDRVDQLGLEKAGRVQIIGIAGREWADMYRGARFDFEGMNYSPRRVASLPSHRQGRRNRDGILGSGFFRQFVIVIDPAAGRVQLHEPGTYRYTGTAEALPLEFPEETPVVEAAVAATNQPPVRARFEIDTGCDGGLCLGHGFVAANPWLLATGRTRDSVREGVGGDARTTSGRVPQLHLGDVRQQNVSANFFKEGSPVDDGLAGHIGWSAFRGCKVIFDYSHKRMFLEPLPRISDR